MRRIISCLGLLVFLFLPQLLQADTDKVKLDNNIAIELIKKHFGRLYSSVIYGSHRYINAVDSIKIGKMLKKCERFKKMGLINYQKEESKDGQFTFIIVKLTDKGETIPHAYNASKDRVAWAMGVNENLKIVRIYPDKEYAYFSFDYKPNDLGKASGFWHSKEWKFRGKAKISYDSLSDDFIFKGVSMSALEKVLWVPTNWVYKKENKLFYEYTRWAVTREVID